MMPVSVRPGRVAPAPSRPSALNAQEPPLPGKVEYDQAKKFAEAFLRVPDPETADALIADKLGEGDDLRWLDRRSAHVALSSTTLATIAVIATVRIT